MQEIAAAIPTVYQGVRFRSRLEARWATCFDLMGMRWTYEPVDLQSYIPDFFVEHGEFANWIAAPLRPKYPVIRTLVEVKPELDLDLLLAHTAKMEQSGWDGPMAIVGARLWDIGPDGVEIGIQRLQDNGKSSWVRWTVIPRKRAWTAWHEAGNQVQWNPGDE